MSIGSAVEEPVFRVRCDQCEDAWIKVCGREDAQEAGWVWPNDGAFQWCPACVAAHKEMLAAQVAWIKRKPSQSGTVEMPR